MIKQVTHPTFSPLLRKEIMAKYRGSKTYNLPVNKFVDLKNAFDSLVPTIDKQKHLVGDISALRGA